MWSSLGRCLQSESSLSRVIIPYAGEHLSSAGCVECAGLRDSLVFLSCPPLSCRPEDVLLQRTHDEIALLHCFLWPVVAFVVGVLIVVLTICAKSLAVKAEAMKKRKFS